MKITLLLCSTLLFIFSTSSTLISAATTTDFIRSSCSSTMYPTVCVQSLSSYAPLIQRNYRQLAHTALTLSTARVHDASTYITHLSSSSGVTPKSGQSRSTPPVPAFQDCVATMTDSANRLKKSLAQLISLSRGLRAGSPKFILTMSNIQTWVSAALTDQNMCLMSLSQAAEAGAMGAAIRKKVVEVSQVTSNALSLVNKIS